MPCRMTLRLSRPRWLTGGVATVSNHGTGQQSGARKGHPGMDPGLTRKPPPTGTHRIGSDTPAQKLGPGLCPTAVILGSVTPGPSRVPQLYARRRAEATIPPIWGQVGRRPCYGRVSARERCLHPARFQLCSIRATLPPALPPLRVSSVRCRPLRMAKPQTALARHWTSDQRMLARDWYDIVLPFSTVRLQGGRRE